MMKYTVEAKNETGTSREKIRTEREIDEQTGITSPAEWVEPSFSQTITTTYMNLVRI